MRDATEVLDLDLELPIRGKTYTVRPPSAADGAQLMNRLAIGIAADAKILDPAQVSDARVDIDLDADFSRQCLGDTLDELIADDVPHGIITFAVETAFLAWTMGKPFAEGWWESGGKVDGRNRPKVLPRTPRADQRRTATRTPAAAASTTPSGASPTGTSKRQPRKKTSPKA